ncbi:MAG: hypothetical protein Q8O52_20845 [Sulfuritalea sp.]|nr:hypothetical protein [Sulfuritalea sp.]
MQIVRLQQRHGRSLKAQAVQWIQQRLAGILPNPQTGIADGENFLRANTHRFGSTAQLIRVETARPFHSADIGEFKHEAKADQLLPGKATGQIVLFPNSSRQPGIDIARDKASDEIEGLQQRRLAGTVQADHADESRQVMW